MAEENLISEKDLKALNKEELLAKAIELRALAVEQDATIEDMNQEIEVLTAEKEEAKSNVVYVTSGKAKYKVLAPAFRLGGQVYGVKDLKESAALVEKVLKKKNQQILAAVEK